MSRLAVQHFDQLGAVTRSALFAVEPQTVPMRSGSPLAGVALGALLYVPASRGDLTGVVRRARARGAQAIVLDLEDAVAADRLADAESAARQVVAAAEDLPAVFVRVTGPEHLERLAREWEPVSSHGIAGFALPKFAAGERGERYLEALAAADRWSGRSLLALPILESRRLAMRETRMAELLGIRALLVGRRDQIAAVRLGGTDLGAVFGLRRDGETPMWQVQVLADIAADVVNVFGRDGDESFVVSGAVWEHYASGERLARPTLRVSPFAEHEAVHVRDGLVARHHDALITEIRLDKANGLTGKTVIHPSHIAVVHALNVVTHEEYLDAASILDSGPNGGATPSPSANKMNESGPHRAWAQRTVRRAEVFGVLRPGLSYVDVLLAMESA